MYTKKAFALQYPDGSLAGKDLVSGGYPFKASDINEVWISTKEELDRYAASGIEGLKVIPISIEVTSLNEKLFL